MEWALITHTVEIISLLDEFILTFCVQEGETTPLPKERMNNCLQVRRMLPGKEEGSCQLLPWYHVPCQVTVGRLPVIFHIPDSVRVTPFFIKINQRKEQQVWCNSLSLDSRQRSKNPLHLHVRTKLYRSRNLRLKAKFGIALSQVAKKISTG